MSEREINMGQSVSGILLWINERWAGLGVVLSILGALLAYLLFDVSLLNPLRQIAASQADYKDKQVQRKIQKEQRTAIKEMISRQLKLGNTFLNSGRYKSAALQFRKVLDLENMNHKAHHGILKTEVFAMMEGDYRPGIVEQQINFILAEAPDDPHGLLLMGNMYMQLRDLDKAGEQYEKALKKDPDVSEACFALGTIFEQREELDQAMAMYLRAVKLSRWNENYLNNLGSLQVRTGAYAAAARTLETVLKLDHRYLLPYCEIVRAYMMMGDLVKASDYLIKLSHQINDEKTAELPQNAPPWFFQGEKGPVLLNTFDEKKYYISRKLTMILSLMGKPADPIPLPELKATIDMGKKIEIDALIAWNRDRLCEKNSRYHCISR